MPQVFATDHMVGLIVWARLDQAHDSIDLIGCGRDERMVVRWDRFDEKLRGKIPS